MEVTDPEILNMKNEKPVDEMSTEELEALLARRKERQLKQQQRETEEYIAKRDKAVQAMLNKATKLMRKLDQFKAFVAEEMERQADRTAKYGKIRTNSKGGFSITSNDGTLRVIRRRDTDPVYDERAVKGTELIKDFLGDTIKKRDLSLYEILIGFLERNDQGDLEYSKVMNLLKHKEKFTDERWTEGLRLILESYSLHLKGFAYEFKTKGPDGKWKPVSLNFSSL